MQLIALSMNLDLLTNATVVDDAITFVSFKKSKSKYKYKYKENLNHFPAIATKMIKYRMNLTMMKTKISQKKSRKSKLGAHFERYNYSLGDGYRKGLIIQ